MEDDLKDNLSDESMDRLISESETTATNKTMPEDELVNIPAKENLQPKKFKFTARGKEIEADEGQIIKYAQQGYDYAQSMNQLKLQNDELEKKYGLYKQVDDYATKNPEWWNKVNNSFQSKDQPVQQASMLNEKIDPAIDELKKQVSELSNFQQEILSERKKHQVEQEDKMLIDEIKSIRTNHSNLDWDSVDANGKSLELKVLEHAQQNKISSFKTAFRDFYHDELVKLAEQKGRELVGKDIQKRTKLGLLGETPTPLKRVQEASNPRRKTYDDLMSEALEELGIN